MPLLAAAAASSRTMGNCICCWCLGCEERAAAVMGGGGGMCAAEDRLEDIDPEAVADCTMASRSSMELKAWLVLCCGQL